MRDDEIIVFRAPVGWKAELENISEQQQGANTSVLIRQALVAKYPTLRKKPKEPLS